MNKKVFILLFIALAVCTFLSKPVLAAWTQAKGHAYNQLTYSYYQSSSKFSSIEEDTFGDIETINQPRYVDYKLSYYGEYGILDTLTVFVGVPYAWVKSEDVQTESDGKVDGPSGVGDIDMGLRYKLVDNLFGSGMLMSVQGAVKIPEAYQFKWDFESPIEYQNLGDGQYDTTISLLFGKGFNKGYMVVGAGYKFRFENNFEKSMSFKPSDQVKVRIDAGYPLHPKLSLRGNIEWTDSVGNAAVSKSVIAEFVKTGAEEDNEAKLIKDTLSLEPDNLTAGVALAYSITPKIQTVLSFAKTLRGIGGKDFLRSTDTGKGETYSVAMVYLY